MRIKAFEWSNYRRMPDGGIDVRNNIVLVGPNDSGKSSLLRAMHIALGMAHGQATSAIRARDFTDPGAPLKIRVVLDDLKDHDRAAFPDEVTTGPPEELTVEVEATVDPSDDELVAVRRH